MKRLFAVIACFCALGLPQFSSAEERQIEMEVSRSCN